MIINKLDYELPERLVAQYPVSVRDHAKMMLYKRCSGKIHHAHFYQLPDYLSAGDLLVVNDSRVIKSRVFFQRPTGGKMEIFFLSRSQREFSRGQSNRWECLFRPSRKVRPGDRIEVTEGFVVRPLERLGSGRWIVACECQGDIYEKLENAGEIPLPPYIRRDGDGDGFPDEDRYQTVFGNVPGSVAAPTAGLHFTDALVEKLRKGGVRIVSVSLDIGYGTFSPIREERVEDHSVHSEWYRVSPGTAEIIREQKRSGGRVIAVGTSVVRTLETAFDEKGLPRDLEGVSSLFIHPGYRFKMIDGMITNFHLPRSSLIALVMAYCGVEELKDCYRVAVANNYRFFSYGDVMLIL
ncbi:MAG: tRNA preQ1(34) S-adenosylmethionine ribosyltransferase-isomerase QueA [Deltaproteobacteria bacterium]|nr:tRNA preQ1(34) S-adenosylmethionine ribosyltransferase-isomerase QueA [Deltaproteobacteria bacterium]